MKKVLYTLFLTFSLSSIFAQITTLPTGIGVGVTNPTIPLHINKPGEVIRIEGAAPYMTFSNITNWQGYLQATAAGTFEIGTKNSSKMTFFTTDTERMSIDGASGRVTILNGLNLINPLRLNNIAGNSGQFLRSQGTSTTPVWADINENPTIGFSAFLGTKSLSLLANSTITGMSEDYDSGNNFDPVTGVFTAPSAGVYHFEVTIPRFSWPTTINSGVLDIYIVRAGVTYLASSKRFSSNNDGYYYDGHAASIDMNINAPGVQIYFNVSQGNAANNTITLGGNTSSTGITITGHKVY